MRWRSGRRSENIEDIRGAASPRPRLRGLKLGGGTTVVLIVLALLMGKDPTGLIAQLLGNLGGESNNPSTQIPTAGRTQARPAAENELADFTSVVLADTEDTWQALFRHRGQQYQKPRLVLFTDVVNSACGYSRAAVGPFYCPGDNKVYIDLGFFADLKRRFGAPGDFAQAYVIAHEVGHHVQNLLGTSSRVHRQRRGLGRAKGNALSVRLELQADCYAGVWAHHADKARQILETGDLQEALNAASAIGDDRLQRRARGRVAPESFTHGSSAQRMRWFKIGVERGTLEACDTFRAAQI